MLDELCGYLKNWFVDKMFFGKFKVSDSGVIIPLDNSGLVLLDGQYIRIIDSIFNDGIYKYSASGIEGLTEEVFDGAIWGLAIPKDFLTLAKEIEDWQKQYGAVDSQAMSPYTSESFGGYAYTKGSAGFSGGDGSGSENGWISAFSSRLGRWRKV